MPKRSCLLGIRGGVFDDFDRFEGKRCPTGKPSRHGWNAGRLFHCAARGFRKTAIFVDRADRLFYRSLLGKYALFYGITVITRVLMGNHFHILVPGNRKSIGALFHRVHTIYAMYFNDRHGFQGHLFEADFEIRTWLHLLAASIYAHLNPTKDFGVKNPGDYEFSSYAAFVGRVPKPDWLDFSPILDGVHPDPDRARVLYIEELRRKKIYLEKRKRQGIPAPIPRRRRTVVEYKDPVLVLETMPAPGFMSSPTDRLFHRRP